MITLSIAPQKAARLEGHDNELHALVRAVALGSGAYPVERMEKPPLNYAIVIDRSGSMDGRPLYEAKRAAKFFAHHLRPQDRLAIIAYSSEVDVLVPGQPIGDGTAVSAAIDAIQVGGSTALHAGWMAGVEQAARMREPHQSGRVMLLSDGCANSGERNPAVLAADAARIAATGITTTTCGLGHDFDENLMLEMARSGQGSAYYGQSAEDLIDPFREELELVSNLIARRLRLSLMPGDGVDMKVLNDYLPDGNSIMLPDLAEGGEAWAMVRLRFSEGSDQPSERTLLHAILHCEALTGEKLTSNTAILRLPRLPAGAFAAIQAHDTVVARCNELRAADLQDRARVAAKAGRWSDVDLLIKEAKREAGENKWVAESLRALTQIARRREVENFSKESVFASRKMRSRLAAADETSASDWEAEDEASRPAYLRKKLLQGRRFDRPEEDGKV